MGNDDHKSQLDQPLAGLSRRDWLLNFGSAVILSGFAGKPRGSRLAEPASATTLPPGLYTPSMDHVSHALNQDGPFYPIPPGSETQFVQPLSGPFVPQAFSGDEFAVIRRLIELILGDNLKSAPTVASIGTPETVYDEVAQWIDLVVFSGPSVRAAARKLTPEQRALAVAYFTSEVPVQELETYEPERICKEGLAWLEQETESKYSKAFIAAPVTKQLELVASISDARPDPSLANAGTRFFEFLKAEAIRGFYTSRLGLKELNYSGNSFYGQSPGCGLPSASDHPSHNPDV